jgi:tetratricopeptide (TPR) repeat protein
VQTAYVLTRLALVEEAKGNLDQAEDLWRRSLAAQRELLGNDHRQPLITKSDLGCFLWRRGKLEEAESLLRVALERQRVIMGADHMRTRRTAYRLGSCLLSQGRYEDAEAFLLDAYEGPGTSRADRADALDSLIDLYDAWGKPEKAAEYRALLREAE